MKPRYDPRVFLALNLSRTVQNKLEACQTDIRQHLLNWHFIPLNNFHVTLHFIGDVLETDIPRINEAMLALGSRMSPFVLTWDNIEFFGDPDNARVLYVGAQRCKELAELNAEVVKILPVLDNLNLFVPHITLAKARQQMEPGAKDMNSIMLRRLRKLKRIGPEPVSIEFNTVHREFCLIETVWVGRTITYEVRHRFPLARKSESWQ